jgi:hypothetical protein
MAVEAARLELSKRTIGEDEIQSIKDEISQKTIKIEERHKQVKRLEDKAKAIRTEIYKTVSPIQKEPQTIDRKINLIVIVFALLAVYQLFREFGMIKFMFTDSLAKWDFSMLLYFIPIIILPIGVFQFWRRLRVGWILMSIVLIYHTFNALAVFLLTWKWNKEQYTNEYSTGEFQIKLREIDNLFSQPNPIIYFLVVIFYGGTLWVLNSKDIRAVYKIDDKARLFTIGGMTILTLLILFGLA